ncbi:hypothetical protein [Calothrix sp. NIES-2100]|uniref:hypothetical protein n=1 Tax=Calothrix sp. NIES-2100 TaxID=1954172 RepID=UPI0030D82C13
MSKQLHNSSSATLVLLNNILAKKLKSYSWDIEKSSELVDKKLSDPQQGLSYLVVGT